MAAADKSRICRSIRRAGRFLSLAGILILFQAVRAGIHWAGWRILQPGAFYSAWDGILSLSMILPALIFYGALKPSRGALGLGWSSVGRMERMALSLAGGLLLALLVSSFFLDRSLILSNMTGVLLTPVLEELLFRGWTWNRLGEMLPARGKSLACFILTTGLFAIWQLGYTDVIALQGWRAAAGAPPLSFILLIKVLVGGAVGLAAGFARWRSGKVYWAIIIHGLWTMFTR